MARVEWVGPEIFALDITRENQSLGQRSQTCTAFYILCPTGFPLSEPGPKRIPLRSRESVETE